MIVVGIWDSVTIGMVLGFSSILLPQLVEEGHLESEKSLVASFAASLCDLGQVFNCGIAGYMIGRFGRRITMLVLCVPLLVGWTMVGFSYGNMVLICIGRFIQGMGNASSAIQVYLMEIADVSNRGLWLKLLKATRSFFFCPWRPPMVQNNHCYEHPM